MKVLVVAPYFFPKIGGMENYAWNFSKGLKNQFNWDVIVITSNHIEKKYKVETIEGIKIYRLPIFFKLSNTPINPLWYFLIKNIIKKEKPDIINAHSPVPFIADVTALVSGKLPYILTYHAESMVKNKGLVDIIIKIYEAIFLTRLVNKATKVIAISPKYFKTFSDKKIISIPPSIDTRLFVPEKKENNNQILFVGRLEKSSEWKGVSYLLKAMKLVLRKNKKAKLVIVGDGDAKKFYEHYSRKLNITRNVKFLGSLTGLRLVKEYHSANVVTLPSTTSAESFGMILIEAMATSTPVIGSNIGGIPNVINDHKNGILVQPQNVADLADAILKILQDKNLAEDFGREGRKKVLDEYSLTKSIKRYHKVLYEATK